MGRPFVEEVAELEQTHRNACTIPIDSLANAIQSLLFPPLLAVGSGGSLTTATVAATLLRGMALGSSSAITPLELANRKAMLRNSGVLIATAGGSNPDAIGALRIAAQSEARQVLALCTKTGSKLSREGAKFSNVDVAELDLGTTGDGFLATNSLWGSSVALLRAFASATGLPLKLPRRLSQIVGGVRWNSFVKALVADATPLWNCDTTIVLYGEKSYPAAVDLESKLVEAALTNVWIADYRHFAHGRHHWIAKRATNTSLVAFVSESDAALAERTLGEIPESVPMLRIEISDDCVSLLTALAHVFPIVQSAGLARGIDPGRPGVPSFGRRIYNLNAFGRLATKQDSRPDATSIAIERKSGFPISVIESQGNLEEWNDSLNAFLKRLNSARFRAVVCDYDGTLCRPSERFTVLSKEVASHLMRLLRAGVHVGIATGRGKSVRESLRESIARKYWGKVTVGYYNGGQIALLKEDELPDGSTGVKESLGTVLRALEADCQLNRFAKIEPRRTQITIEARHARLVEQCWTIASNRVSVVAPAQVKLVRSSHSFDLLPVSVSKLEVLRRLPVDENQVLTVGDMGRWPGNDCELLSHPLSLSVDQASPDWSTCWNLARPGKSGVDAMLDYFDRMTVDDQGRMRFRSGLGGRR